MNPSHRIHWEYTNSAVLASGPLHNLHTCTVTTTTNLPECIKLHED